MCFIQFWIGSILSPSKLTFCLPKLPFFFLHGSDFDGNMACSSQLILFRFRWTTWQYLLDYSNLVHHSLGEILDRTVGRSWHCGSMFQVDTGWAEFQTSPCLPTMCLPLQQIQWAILEAVNILEDELASDPVAGIDQDNIERTAHIFNDLQKLLWGKGFILEAWQAIYHFLKSFIQVNCFKF